MSNHEPGPAIDRIELKDAILSNCIKVCFQTFYDCCGLQKISDSVKLPYKHCGMALANNSKQRFSIKGNGLEQIGIPLYWLDTGISDGKISLSIYEKGAVIEISDCVLKGVHPTLCMASHFMSEGICEVINPDFGFAYTDHLTSGDMKCRIVYQKKGAGSGTEDLGKLKHVVPSLGLAKEEMDYLKYSTIAEIFIINTRAFSELLGHDKMLSLVSPRMAVAGRELGARLIEKYGSSGQMTLDAVSLVNLVTSTIDQKIGTIESTSDHVRYSVRECPLKDAPPEVCEQLAEFLDGLFKALNGHHFQCEERMSSGSKTCQCILCRTDELNLKDGGAQPPLDAREDPLGLLKRRLAKGEISLEEYKAIRNALME